MKKREKSQEVLSHNEKFIAGGVVSLNRKCEPHICFKHGKGSRVWDVDGNEYIDYQAGFSAFFLGHNDSDVNKAVCDVLQEQRVMMGAGPMDLEGELAELVCQYVPSVDSVQITNTGSEATYHAIRIARAVTGRDDLIIMQGGYNGWHNAVAANVSSTLADVGERVSPGEYPYDALSAGVPECQKRQVHVVNFNDLESVEHCARRYSIACVILEPILQNIGVVKPLPGYLEGLRKLADQYGFLLIFDEVKTGFRHALGGFQSVCDVQPDLSTFGKAVANGYPMGIIGGKRPFMDFFIHPEKEKRVLIAGTYNAHPVSVAAALATLRKLADPALCVYEHVRELGRVLETGITSIFSALGEPFHFSREGSAFCLYFMDHAPRDYHDILGHHDADLDRRYRLGLIDRGVFNFPLPTKQGSISYAHTMRDIEETLTHTEAVARELLGKGRPALIPA